MPAPDWTLSDFDYSLPPELIAQQPPAQRSGGRMLVVDARQDRFEDGWIRSFPEQLSDKDLLVFNNTRVIPARLHGHKLSGGKVEVLVERITGTRSALVQLRASKSPAAGTRLLLADDALAATVRGRVERFFELDFEVEDLLAALEQHGHMPLPPYIERPDAAEDAQRYQTLFGRHAGAVAAPTAGLHFDEPMLDEIRGRGVATAEVTLHVGAGTFAPVREENLQLHEMHSERLTVTDEVVDQVAACRARGGRVVAVGTTVVRALETAAAGGALAAMSGESRLFIRPGFEFRVVDAMLTNFHLPKSTLLMLVSAFAGYHRMRRAYQHAIAQQYRFFSYGDAMWMPCRGAPDHEI